MSQAQDELLNALLDSELAATDEIVARPEAQAPLSFSQQQLWSLQSFEPTLTAYNLSRAFRLHGPLNVTALNRAFVALIDRHASLRTRFASNRGIPFQEVMPSVPFELRQDDVSDVPQAQREARLMECLKRTVTHVFDLSKPPLLVAHVIALAPQEHVLVTCMHHIVSDAWSNPIIAKDLGDAYARALQDDGAVRLRPPDIRYTDYARWQRARSEAGELARDLKFWNEYLGAAVPALELPADRVRPSRQTFAGAREPFVLDAALVARLHQFCRNERCTPFVVLLAAWQIVLSRWSAQLDFAIGVPTSGRLRHEVQSLVGFFVNTLVFRARLRPEMTLREICKQVRADALAGLDHAGLPFESICESRVAERDPARSPVFQVMFSSQTAEPSERLELAGLRVEPLRFRKDTAKFELSIDVTVGAQRVAGRMEYNTDLFDADSIVRLARWYENVLTHLVDRPDGKLAEVELRSPAELEAQAAWGAVTGQHTASQTLHSLIEEQARCRADEVAVTCEGHSISYGELNRRANRLAHRLIAAGARPEAMVGVCLGRGIDMVIAVLATLKSGAAYVPLDPEYPQERLRHMVEDSGVRLVLAQPDTSECLQAAPGVTVLQIDAPDAGEPVEHDPNVPMRVDQLAYVIYTSGSTGKPKGAQLTHANVVRLLDATRHWFAFDASDVWTLFHSYAFDFSVWELFGALCHGGRLVIVPHAISRAPEEFLQLLREQRVTVLNQTPSAFQQLLRVPALYETNDLALRVVIFGGEALSPSTLRPWIERFGDARPRLINMYGITETTVHVTFRPITLADLNAARSPIGQTIPDLGMRVLGPDLSPMPPGVPGELYVEGAGLARGYLHRAGITSERFIADPIGRAGARLYRTGDRARWNDDGELEYLGRVDQQLKIRGFRIEPGEIEAQLLSQPEVREAPVVPNEFGGSTRLVAYVTLYEGAEIRGEQLRDRLARSLPDYMLPASILVLPALPLTSNGKIDRKALPSVAGAALEGFEPPEGEVEIAFAKIWQEVLGAERVGRRHNFFVLGGDSILSLQIVARAREAGWAITPRQLFEHQTVAALAAVAQPHSTPAEQPAEALHGSVPLLPIQAEFFARDIAARHHWNQAVLLRSAVPLNIAALEQALQALVTQHDALRLRFKQVDGSWQQFYADSAGAPPAMLQVRSARGRKEIEMLCSRAQRSLHLSDGPLLRAVAIHVADDSWRLLLVLHHLIVDGVSWRVLLEDLRSAYAQAEANRAIELPDRTSSYRRWALQLQEYASTHPEEFDDWQSSADDCSTLPVDHPTGSRALEHQAVAQVKLNRLRTRALLQEAPAAYRTQVNDLLLTALARALSNWSGHQRVLIDLEGHGREDIFAGVDVSRTVGWFTSLFPVALAAAGELDAALKQVKETLRNVPNRGIGFGAFRHLGSDEQRQRLAELPRAAVAFNYLGQFDGTFENDSTWTPAEESVGRAADPSAPAWHELTVNGRVFGGELRLNLRYSKRRYAARTMRALARSFEAELEQIIEHCCSGVRAVTPSDFPLARLIQPQLDALPMPAHRLQDLYPLSPMQAGMLFQGLSDPRGIAYINQLRLDIDALDEERFCAAWQAALDRHDILRTGFLHGTEPPLQWVAHAASVPIEAHDWRERADHTRALSELAQSELDRGFDVAQPPLMRLTLVRIGPTRHHLIWTRHHLLLDGWSTSQLMGEVMRHYAGERVPAPTLRYKSYIAWLQDRSHESAARYWQSQLRALDEPTLLADVVPKPIQGQGHAEHALNFDEQTAAKLTAACREQRVTLNTLIQAAWSLLLRRHTGRATVVFGATTAGRPVELAGIQQLLGLFINTLPVIATPAPERIVGDWLRDLQAQNLASREYEHTPLYEIQRWAGLGGRGLFDTVLVFENYPIDAALRSLPPGSPKLSGTRHREETHYPLTLLVTQGRTISIRFRYDEAHFDAESVDAFAGHLAGLIVGLVESAAGPLQRVDHLTDADRAKLQLWQRARAPASDDSRPVHRCFEQQVAAQPQAIALIAGDEQLTYAQLNARANRLAHRLIACGVKLETPVGVSLERSPELVIALLAILKAGGAYVPLDPAYPAARRILMQEESGVHLVLGPAELSAIEDPAWPSDDPQVVSHADTLAYILFTSGSTGRPKGVAVTHRAIVQRVTAGGFARLDRDQRVLQFAPVAFDASTLEIWGCLCNGGTLVQAPAGSVPLESLAELIETRGVTTAWLTSALFNKMVERHGRSLRGLQQLLTGGEAISAPHAVQALERLAGGALINGYGPTETTTFATCHAIDASEAATGRIAIGRPIGATECYILDDSLQPVAPGAMGELYIGGAGLARGYMNRASATCERFIANPWADSASTRLYRTGDRVRWRADGAIEYLGRTDQMVKIRGFRIEPGEVTMELLRQPHVSAAVTVVRDTGGGSQLISYVSPQPGATLNESQLKQSLSERLPAYMLPAACIVLPVLPVNANGKIDIRSLPAPHAASFEAPQGEVEEALAAIWRQVLNVERVGRHDNFFELGGHSLLLLQARTQMRALSHLRLDFEIGDLMRYPTIAGLVASRCDQVGASQSIIRLNASMPGTPVFCLHSGRGPALQYLPLARALNGTCTVYGVMCRMLLDFNHRDVSVQQMATDYLAMIREVQPHGPYALLGYSLGGVLAATITAMLEDEGERVEFLGLIDSFVPLPDRPGERSLRQPFVAFLRGVLPQASIDETRLDGLRFDSIEALEDDPAVVPFIQDMLNARSGATRAAFGELDAVEILRAFITHRWLIRLTIQTTALSTLRTEADYWWIEDRPAAHKAHLIQTLGQARSEHSIAADHSEIIRAPALIASVAETFRQRRG
ncbi:amino acid adenylation domain-containing protein [Steroidobacter flavus]|uniref:Amino acid adenylation domain-containing protein n=1 Tax=Steroidobacter flavus TaxID=1842136 RepID=A0ABV8T2R3_9GAMM